MTVNLEMKDNLFLHAGMKNEGDRHELVGQELQLQAAPLLEDLSADSPVWSRLER